MAPVPENLAFRKRTYERRLMKTPTLSDAMIERLVVLQCRAFDNMDSASAARFASSTFNLDWFADEPSAAYKHAMAKALLDKFPHADAAPLWNAQ